MRKVKDAKDLSSNELIYFKGHAKATYMSDGRTVEDAINDIPTGGGDADLSDYVTRDELSVVATSGSYNDLTNKPTIPNAVTESTVSGWGFTKNTGTYSKPSTGIPKNDLASAVQISLGKADTALQSYTEQYKGTVTSVKINGSQKNPSNGVVDLGTVITSHQDISGKQDKLVSAGGTAKVDWNNDIYNVPGIRNELDYIYFYQPINIAKGLFFDSDNEAAGGKLTFDNAGMHYEILGTNPFDVPTTMDIIHTGDGTKFLSDDGTYKTVSGGSGGGGGSSSGNGAYIEINHGTNDTTFTLTPNTFHLWDEVASLTLTFGSETSGVANEYLFQFTSGSTATTLSLPSDLKWANDTPPTIAQNMIYQISILKGLASCLEFGNEPSIFPMYLTTPNSGYRQPDELSIALADYIITNSVFDGLQGHDCVIPPNSLFIDGHEVSGFYSLSGGTQYNWYFTDGYDYGYFAYESRIYVSGANKGRMERWDDD